MRSRIAHLSVSALVALATWVGGPDPAGADQPPGPEELQIGPPSPVPPRLLVLDAKAHEADGQIAFLVSLDKPAQHPISFDADVVHTGTSDADFVSFPYVNLSIAAGATEAELIFDLVQGDGVEEAETFVVHLIDIEGTDLIDPWVNGEILDGDGPQLSVADTEVVEGDDGDTVLEFEVETSYANPGPIDLRAYTATVGFGAEPPGDYEPVDETFQIEAHSFGTTTQVTVHGDTDVEDDEMLVLFIADPSAGGITDDTAVGRIVNDDEPLDEAADDDDGDDEPGPEDEPEGAAETVGDDDGIDHPEAAGATVDRSGLPYTGADVAGLGLVGLTLVAVGGAAVLYRRFA
jgi:hypothetical protein